MPSIRYIQPRIEVEVAQFMPELPEVENVALSLRDALLGKRLDGIEVRWAKVLKPTPQKVRKQLCGSRLVAVGRHGKYIFLTFEPETGPPSQLMLHLRMTGQIFVDPAYTPDKHLRVTFDFEGQPVYYRDLRKFGSFTLFDGTPGRTAIPHVGPDMLEITVNQWLKRIAHRRAPLKSLLLHQGIAAGLGNIYVDEALFRARIHPLTAPVSLDEKSLRRVFRESRQVLRTAVKEGGTTYQDFINFRGKPGNFRSQLRVYGRTGEACLTCKTPVERLKIGGRSAHFCPHCQPDPR
jgi:formamidopyrimidine-DNA glycosylase